MIQKITEPRDDVDDSAPEETQSQTPKRNVDNAFVIKTFFFEHVSLKWEVEADQKSDDDHEAVGVKFQESELKQQWMHVLLFLPF